MDKGPPVSCTLFYSLLTLETVMKYTFLISLLLILCMVGSASAQVTLGWTDDNDPACDYFILYRSASPDTGYLMLDFVTPLEGTQQYMYYDSTAAQGIPTYYKVAAVRDLDHSDLGPWSRALWYDKSGGARAFYSYEYWPGMELRNMLIVYTPLDECELLWSFRYTDPDLVAVKCAQFTGTVPAVNLIPGSP